VPAFVPRLAETARSQPFEVPNSLLSQKSRTCGCWAGTAMVLGAAEYGVRDVHTWQSAEGTYWSAYGVPAAAHYVTWLAEHPDYGLSDIEAEVAAHATARTGEPTEETEPSPNGPDDSDGPGHPQHPDRLGRPVAALRHIKRLAVEGGQRRGHRVGGIGLAALAAGLPIRPDHLDHRHPRGRQVAGQPAVVAAGALHPTLTSSPCARIQASAPA
jgi:hypothetical protein